MLRDHSANSRISSKSSVSVVVDGHIFIILITPSVMDGVNSLSPNN